MLVDKVFKNWFLIGWQYSRQPIGSLIRKPLLTNTDFHMGIISNTGPKA